MQQLLEKYQKKLLYTNTDFVRGLYQKIDWNSRLIGIKGQRGVGKTTLLLQRLKLNPALAKTALYVSLDNFWFTQNNLLDLADDFVKNGGTHLFLDEVHKYPNWSITLKNLYDDYPELNIVFTASSLLEILNSAADLSRRAVVYTLQGLSYREFLEYELKLKFPVISSVQQLVEEHQTLALKVCEATKPLQHFKTYLQYGYFPFYKESINTNKIEEITRLILEIELPQLRGVEVGLIYKLKQLLSIIAESVPYTPNISKLSEKIGVNRNTLATYLNYLDEAQLTKNLYRDANGVSLLQKPAKIYLENTNLIQVFSNDNQGNVGNIRETFFINQLAESNLVEFTEKGDFSINRKYIFEVGGKNKTVHQISDVADAFVAADDIEIGSRQTIPLYLFGFLY